MSRWHKLINFFNIIFHPAHSYESKGLTDLKPEHMYLGYDGMVGESIVVPEEYPDIHIRPAAIDDEPSLNRRRNVDNDKIISIYGNEFRIVEHEIEPVAGAVRFETIEEAEEYLTKKYLDVNKTN